MKPLLFALCVVFACDSLSAQTPVWQPSPGHTQVPIWPGAAPDAEPAAGPEVSRWWPAGRGGFTLGNVSQPTIDRKSTRLNSSHGYISYAVFCLKKKKKTSVREKLITPDYAEEYQ